jgi:TPR repeat protein
MLLLLCACGAGSAGSAVQPPSPTAADAFGMPPSCTVDGFGQPLIVDMPGARRADVEVRMKQGIVLVKHDCTTLEVLPSCHLEGTYRFLGITPKEELVSIDRSDELSANLPFSAVELGGRLRRGQTLHVAMSMIGKQTSTRRQVRRDELSGGCEGATHFVQAALVGAFVMRSATSGELRTAAEVFGVGAEAASSSSRSVAASDGVPAACRTAQPGLDAPVANCGAPLRLDLVPLDGPLPARDDPREIVADRCPNGWRMSGGVCTREAEAAHQCAYGDLADCTAQCGAGNAASCAFAGYMHAKGDRATKDEAQAKGFFEKACTAGSAPGCFEQAERTADLAQRAPLYERACDRGHARSCTFFGFMAQYGMGGPVDYAAAAKRTEQGCNGGDSMGCATLADLYTMGRGVTKDEARAVEIYRRACEARDIYGCGSLALMHAYGFHVAKDESAARLLLERTCDPNKPAGTASLGLEAPLGFAPVVLGGLVFQRSCPGFDELDLACERYGDARSCTVRAVSQLGEPKGRELLRKGCAGGDPYACVIESGQRTSPTR